MTIAITETAEGVRFAVRVTPRASRTAVVGVLGDAIRIALEAPAVEGRANAALVEFVAEWLDVRRADVTIAGGERGRNKVAAVRGRKKAEIVSRLSATESTTREAARDALMKRLRLQRSANAERFTRGDS